MGNGENYNENKNGRELIVEGHRLSSVGPGRVTVANTIYEPNSMDLAMKAHYIGLVYLFDGSAVSAIGLDVPMLKEALFSLLSYYYEVCGRFRNADSGGDDSGGGGRRRRPYMKCNDCGVRVVEGRSRQSVNEWVEDEKLGYAAPFQYKYLVYHHTLGPELMFSPPVFIQITTFSCGGISLGISWAHVLGDVFSVSQFMYQLSQFLQDIQPSHPPTYNKSPPNPFSTTPHSFPIKDPLSLKQVGPLGDHWAIDPPCNMETFTFHATHSQLNHILKITNHPGYFEALCAFIWHTIAKVGPDTKPNTITIIKQDLKGPKVEDMVLGNNQVVSSVKAHFSVAEAHLREIVGLIHDKAQDERAGIAAVVDRHLGGSDFIVYGANLTFVDLSEAGFYEFEVKGFRPKLVNCFVDGIGEEGVVLVMPPPKKGEKNDNNIDGEGNIITLILPNNYMEATKQGLKKVGVLLD